MTDKPSNKWKDYLLKSSLPLEQVVSEKLETHNFSVHGEFAYNRPNEQGIITEFSVDLHAVDYFQHRKETWGFLNLLIECKYNHPGIKWIFTPFPEKGTVIGSNVLTVLEDLCTQRITSKQSIHQFGKNLNYCTKGVEIYDNGIDLNSITRGIYQLRYAIPNLIALEYKSQLNTWHQEDLTISLVCPILVTTASLYVLKAGLSIGDFQTATALTDVAQEVDSLIIHQDIGPQLDSYCDDLSSKFHTNFPNAKNRIKELNSVYESGNSLKLPATWKFDDHFSAATKNILVIKLDALDALLKELRSSVKKAGKYIERKAKLVSNIERGFTKVVPIADNGR